ncbi:MAG: DHH family phosphoesterase [Clostridia bacterium]|nr:DHH family phosphoesterase [Clostridia bacterium]MBN2882337.1 DHH family phosphoesterase [Clostridia bacterium]
MMKINDLIFKFSKDLHNQADCLILPHVNADGDCIGSSVALNNFLKTQNIKSRILVEEKIPEKYRNLDPCRDIEVYDGREISEKFVVSLDTGDFKRLGKRGDALSGKISWNIDHHKTNTSFAINNFIDVGASSTGEIIYSILQVNKFAMDKDTASALFTAISTDTGGLRYSNTTSKSMRICADLLETGIDISEISHLAFDLMPYPKLLLKCIAIQKMDFFCDKKIAVISLGLSDYDFLGGKDEYFDGIVNITVNTEGVVAGALVRETDSGYKVNFRSNTDEIDVSVFAEALGGGGHNRASGCTIEASSLNDATEIVIAKLCGAV